MKQVALVFAAVLLALGLLFFVRASQPAAPIPERSAIPSVESATSTRTDRPTDRAKTDADPAHVDREVAAAEQLATEKEDDGFTFFVVDGRTGKSIAGAEVRWADVEKAEPMDFDDLEARAMDFRESFVTRNLARNETEARTSGHVTTSDARGFVRLPMESWPPIFCRKGELAGGSSTLYDDHDVPTLHLWPDGDLRVRVLDAAGEACAGTEVRLIRDEKDWNYVVQSASTDATGLATLAHACVEIADDEGRSPGEQRTWRLSAAALPEGEGAVKLDSTALPRIPVEIRLPAAGSVELAVLDSVGSRLASDLPVILEVVDEENTPLDPREARVPWPGGRANFDQLIAPIVDGKATFEHVGLGQKLLAVAARNRASKPSVLRFAGPTQPGERVRCELIVGSESVVLTARVLDSDGAPIASAPIDLSLYSAPSPARNRFMNVREEDTVSAASSMLDTDGQGRFTVEYAMDAAFNGRPMLVIWRPHKDGAPMQKLLDLQDVWSVGRRDLGDVRIERAPILAAGVVVDDLGEPVPGATVSVDPREGGFHLVRHYPTDELGRFEIRSARPFTAVDLDVERDGFASTHERDGQLGRSDWSIVLRRASKLSVRVDFPVGTTSSDFSLSLHHMENGIIDENSFVSGGLRDDGTFEWNECTPGSYAMLVRSVEGFESRTLATRENLVVRLGETTDAGVIDLSGGASFVSLTVLGPDGKPLQNGSYAAGSNGVGLIDELWSAHWGKEVDNGKLRLAREGEILNVAIAAPGARTRVFPDVHDGDVLRLERGIPIALAISNTVSRPAPGITLQAGLVRAGLDKRARVMSPLCSYTGEFDERGEARLFAPEPGRYEVKWMLVRKHLGGHEGREWHDDPSVIEVLDSSELQRFDVRCPIDPATAWDGK